MSRSRLLVLLGLSLAGLAGCPPSPPPVASPVAQPGGGATTSSATTAGVTSAADAGWAAQAEKVAAGLESVFAKAESNDRAGALAELEETYFTKYEPSDWNLEVASKQNLGEELLDGRMRNVAQVREEAFAQIKSAVRAGAPATTVRKLVDALAAKVRGDARALDALHAPRPK